MNNQKIFTSEEEKENNERKAELIELVRSGEAVLIVGAGSSKRVAYPDWSCLLKELGDLACEYNESCKSSQKTAQDGLEKPSFWQKLSFFVRFLNMRKSFNPNCEKREKDPLGYAEDIKSYVCKQKGGIEKYYALLGRLFESKDPPCTDFHRKLVAMPFRGILTTNYDRVLEAALDEILPPSGDDNSLVISEDSAGQVDNFLMGMTDGSMPRRVAHLHGRYDYPKTIILSSKEYQRVYGSKHTKNQMRKKSKSTLHQKLLWSVLASRRVVFVGFSMNDPYFKRMLETVSNDLWRGNKSTHYAILGIWPDRFEYSKAKKLKRDYGIDTVFYQVSDDSHRGLEDIVDEIAKKCGVKIQSPIDKLDWLEQTNQRMKKFMGRKIDNEIDRGKLLKDLQNFTLRGNGVIIGGPGVGKTYLLKELHRSLEFDGIPHLLLPIDQLGDGTSETLRKELSYEGDLIDKLKSIPISDKKATLLFDTFDAARNEQTRKRFLQLIRRATQDLKQWNVVVTVRTYDAEKSQKFLDLFGNLDNNDLPQYHSKGILCRHFTIPPLNEDEIQQAFDQIPNLESIYNKGSDDFKQLLANPFNLWLLEKIPKSPQDVRALSQIHSEVQLLDWFWKQRIKDEKDESHRWFLLEQIVCWMVKERSLTVRRNDVYKDLGLDNPARQKAWNDLLSDEILAEVSSTRQRIAFSHDILFDHAISILLIEDEPQQLEDFVREDSSRLFFLRPSFTYFFTRLWYDAPESFWNAFWHVFRSNLSVPSRLVRLIPTSVIVNETRKIDQLNPLLEKLQNGEGIATETVTHLLQLLRALQIERDPLWSVFFDRVSIHLHRDFAWDLATLTSEMLERGTKTENIAVINACGRIGRRLLKWIWQEREHDWYKQLGSYWAVPLVAKTYGTNVEESRTLLKKVLTLRREGHFPMDALTQLAEHVDKIWDDDPEFVRLIYRAGITSNRRQGYSMCQHWLVQHFPDFLRAAPLPATQAAIESLNCFIIGNYTYHQESVELADLKRTFKFRGKLVHFVEDRSHIGDDRGMLPKPAKMADTLFEFIKKLAASKDSRLDLLLDVFRNSAQAAFFWKRLLRTASQFPEAFVPHLLELFSAKPIQMNDVVFYELCTFLAAAASGFTAEQQLQVENTILKFPEEIPNENYREFFERRRNQLLAQIPPNLLHTDAAKEIRAAMERENAIPENRRPFQASTWVESYTDEKWLQEQGVDTTTPENQEVQRVFKPLDQFHSDWLNKRPTEEAAESILPTLEEGYAAIMRGTGVDKAVIDLLWYKVTTCAAILGQVADNPESHLFTFCRQVLLHAAKHRLPEPDPEYDAQFNSSVYSPFPRHEASMGLLSLIFFHPDAEILDAIEKLASDPVPSVRMVTAGRLFIVSAKAPEKFWHIVDNRSTYETNHVVQEHFYATLAWTVAANEEKTTRVMDKLLKRTLLSIDTLEPANSCIDLLMRLAIDCENSWALETIEDTFLKDPIRFTSFLNRAVFWVMHEYVAPKELETSEGYEKAKRAIAWIDKVVTVISGKIEELCATFAEPRTEEVKQQLRDIYEIIDEVVMCLFLEFAYESGGSEQPGEKIPNELRCRFYCEVKPLMERIIAFALDPTKGVMFAATAHHFIQLLTSFLSCNPKEILRLAEGVARSSKQSGYNFDSLAVRDVVKFVEVVLADHRSEVRDGEGLKDLQNLLDIFVEAGWSEAIELVLRLDEIYR